VEINTEEDGFRLHQQRYIKKLSTLHDLSPFKECRSLRAKLSWVTNTRPDISCAVAQSAQVTEKLYDEEPLKYTKVLNGIVKHLRKASSLVLKYPKLDIDKLKLRVYSDVVCKQS
jgi:hypothetical protein